MKKQFSEEQVIGILRQPGQTLAPAIQDRGTASPSPIVIAASILNGVEE